MTPSPNDASAGWIANPTDEDYANAARLALRAKNYALAIEQASAAVAARPLYQPHLRLLDEILATVRAPLAWLKLPPEGAFFGLCAARARALARLGRVDEALDCLFQAATFRPATPFLPWGVDWVAKRAAAKRVRPDALSARIIWFTDAACSLDRVEEARPNLEAALAIADKVHARHPSGAALVVVLSRLYRALGRFDEALARLGHCDVATWEIAVEGASVHHGLGDGVSRMRWLERARDARPEEPSSLLELGDAQLDDGDLMAAGANYARADELDRDLEWGRISAAYVAALESRRGGAMALSLDVASTTGKERAHALERDLGAYTDCLVDPIDPMAGVIRASHARALASSSSERMVVRVRTDGPLAPSAQAAFELAMKACGRVGELTVEHGAGAAREGPLWAVRREAASAPVSDVIDRIAAIARTPFSWRAWSRQAAESIVGDAQAVLHAMAHPPIPPSRDTDLVHWVHGFQIAAALVLAYAPECHATREESLWSLLEGTDDWSSAAALLGLRALAERDESLVAPILARAPSLLPGRASRLPPYSRALAIVGCELATGEARRPFLRLRARVRRELEAVGGAHGPPIA